MGTTWFSRREPPRNGIGLQGKAKLSTRLSKGTWRILRLRIVWIPLLALAAGLAGYVLYLDHLVTSRFDGRRWNLPAHVYARPLELYAGLPLSRRRAGGGVAAPRLSQRRGLDAGPARHLAAQRRAHRARDPAVPVLGRRRGIAERSGRLRGRGRRQACAPRMAMPLPLLRLDPLLIGSVFPIDGEDRIILAPGDVPPLIPVALKVVEDRRFDEHPGVDVIAILRAIFVNVTSGQVRQGASTLTQQLVRSYFLTNERTLSRKAREALMALLLESHYTKDDILNSYLNEIYLGQDGSRAIHGFGLASQFYFSKPLSELQLSEIATLVAIVRGPSYYDPRRHPERVLERRNLVLKLLAEEKVITPEEAKKAAAKKLGIVLERGSGATYFPAFLALVHTELATRYHEDDLTTEGLRIFTTLDPMVQSRAEVAMAQGLDRLQRPKKPDLEGALVVVNPQSAEVLAVVGGRRAGFEGYNRALDAKRPIGSLIKPAVYLAALQDGRTPATRVDDAPIVVKLDRNRTWSPENFDGQAHGQVPLVRALAESMNQATVRLGLEVGVPKVVTALKGLGIEAKLEPNPSLLLGALDLSPMEVAQFYSTLASGGFRTPLRAVRSVQGPDGEPLSQFTLQTEQAADPAVVYELDQMLVQVMQRGTGRAARSRLPPGIIAAGKTGHLERSSRQLVLGLHPGSAGGGMGGLR